MSSFNNYDFDFGLGSGFSNRGTSRPLKDEKHPSSSSSTTTSYSSSSKPTSSPSSSSSSSPWTHQPNKPTWTHQPSPSAAPRSGLSNPTSMVGDIYGKSWASAAPSATRIGIPESKPNLFGDLVGSALGQGKSSSNVPLKAAPPKNSYSMGNLSDSLPKSTTTTTNPTKPSWGSADNLGNFSSVNNASNKIGNPLGGNPPMKSSSVAPSNPKKDPFGSLVDFGSKPSGNPPAASANSSNTTSGSGDYSFGVFQNADFPKMDTFGTPDQSFSAPQPAQAKGGADPMDFLFSSTTSHAPAAAVPSENSGSQMFSEANDWDFGSEFGGNDTGGTTELEGLPPPPSGVSSSMAKSKGLDNYKQGQYADAIKWLSWAVVLLEKSGDSSATTEVLSCRASCYKEVGEYKKAVADCSKILDKDSTNVSVLLQRALLYESTEKYRLGADDLRAVLKFDPSNRLAKSTIHRLNKLAD